MAFGIGGQAGCATTAVGPSPPTVFKDARNIVRLEPQPKGPDLPPGDAFSHPARLTEDEMRTLIQSLRLRKSPGFFGWLRGEKPTWTRPFTEDEARFMAGPLSEALARAKPDERVAFMFTQRRGILSTGITSGVLFVKGERLHVILGRYRSASRPSEKDILLSDEAIPSPPYTGFRLSAGPFQQLADLDRLPVWEEHLGQDHWVMLDYQALLSQPIDTASEPIPVKEPAPEEKPEDTLKEKLRTLKELRDENLITEQEYEKKRAEFLEQFR
jgi:hypothetical protein